MQFSNQNIDLSFEFGLYVCVAMEPLDGAIDLFVFLFFKKTVNMPNVAKLKLRYVHINSN